MKRTRFLGIIRETALCSSLWMQTSPVSTQSPSFSMQKSSFSMQNRSLFTQNSWFSGMFLGKIEDAGLAGEHQQQVRTEFSRFLFGHFVLWIPARFCHVLSLLCHCFVIVLSVRSVMQDHVPTQIIWMQSSSFETHKVHRFKWVQPARSQLQELRIELWIQNDECNFKYARFFQELRNALNNLVVAKVRRIILLFI